MMRQLLVTAVMHVYTVVRLTWCATSKLQSSNRSKSNVLPISLVYHAANQSLSHCHNQGPGHKYVRC